MEKREKSPFCLKTHIWFSDSEAERDIEVLALETDSEDEPSKEKYELVMEETNYICSEGQQPEMRAEISDTQKDFGVSDTVVIALPKAIEEPVNSIVSDNAKVIVVKWTDNRCVLLGSTIHGISSEEKQKTAKRKKTVEIPSPSIIFQYNKHMEGVDKSNALIGFYSSTGYVCSKRLVVISTVKTNCQNNSAER
ncbi:hypothetical protein ILUMI_20544 [Ignelater luminosus]|uniref:PiggyBac transposable element-derived protein domain-containing protein n=1 Tax=Ignelater luminosus TaxID=2038154 RepID=A0A8K0CHY7_IGNLU|nr:hypothetical protein ILUMI_20544 [Ignelater luminosus]